MSAAIEPSQDLAAERGEACGRRCVAGRGGQLALERSRLAGKVKLIRPAVLVRNLLVELSPWIFEPNVVDFGGLF